jgi:hypothetical protein
VADVPALAIGAVLGDSDAGNMAWSRAIGALSLQAQERRQGVNAPVRLNVAYHVDGRLVPNEFTGVRTGRFDKRTNRLVVQAAVPGDSVEDKRKVLMGLLNDAVDEAERYLRQKKLAAGLPEIRGIVEQLAAR